MSPIELLLVEDDEGDATLVAEALREGKPPVSLHVVEDGEKALAFLRRQGPSTGAPRPQLILLDLNLPRMDGRELLQEIKSDPDLRRIPVVVFTTSKADEEVVRCYDFHANCYVRKPLDLDGFFRVVRAVRDFWADVALLPGR